MRRKLIIGERIMYVDATTPLNCVFTVKIRGHIVPDHLLTALNKIQQKHPLLRTRIKENDSGIPYFVSSNKLEEIPVRLVKRLNDEQWQQESKQEWKKLFNHPDQPLARVVWLKGEEVSELLLVCPHCVCDGTTMVTLMSELLLLLDHPKKEMVAYPPFNSIEELLSPGFSASSAKIFKTRLFAVMASVFFLLKSGKNKNRAGEGYFLHWKFNEAATSSLAKACKTAGVTIHAALCIAFMEAFQSVKGKQAKGKVICPVDVRKFVPEITNETMFAFAPIAELSLSRNPKLNFWKKAEELKESLQKKIAAMKVPELLVMSEYFHASVNRMVKFLRSTEGGHDVTLSNMGKLGIPEHYDSFEVETLYSPTVGFPWRNANTLVVSTFKGKMDFTFLSNDGFLKEDEANAIKEKALGLLIAEMEVSYAK